MPRQGISLWSEVKVSKNLLVRNQGRETLFPPITYSVGLSLIDLKIRQL